MGREATRRHGRRHSVFITAVPEEQASPELHDVYEATRAQFGHVPNYAKAFSHRPAVYRAWTNLISTITGNLDRRLYEVATVAAARAQHSSYCSLAHGRVLRKNHMSDDELLALVAGGDAAALSPLESAIVEFAEQVTRDASSVTQADVDRLKELGLTDEAVLDIVLAVAARNFFSRVLDAVGAQPDAVFNELPAALRDALTVGRPIAAE